MFAIKERNKLSISIIIKQKFYTIIQNEKKYFNLTLFGEMVKETFYHMSMCGLNSIFFGI